MLVGLWRTHAAEMRRMADEAGLEQKMRLQAAERERLANIERAAHVDRLGQEEAVRQHRVAAQRDLELLGRAAAADDERRRAKRWEGFYKPAPGCERSETVECANAFIRARRRFNELYEREGRRRPGP